MPSCPHRVVDTVLMSRVISYSDAYIAARRQFMASGDVDMKALAEELIVGRATLYRVVGSRDRLLGRIVADLTAVTQSRAVEAAASEHPPSVERIVQAAYRMNRDVVAFRPLRQLVTNDPETAFRVLFTEIGGVHAASVASWSALMDATARDGGFALPRDTDRLAYMFVRIGESMIFADLLHSHEPDLELARDLHRALLTLPA